MYGYCKEDDDESFFEPLVEGHFGVVNVCVGINNDDGTKHNGQYDRRVIRGEHRVLILPRDG